MMFVVLILAGLLVIAMIPIYIVVTSGASDPEYWDRKTRPPEKQHDADCTCADCEKRRALHREKEAQKSSG